MIINADGLRLNLRNRGTEGFRADRAALFQVFFAGEYDFLLSRLRPGDAVLDAGANIGCFSLKASRLVGSEGKVVAVEPEPSNAVCLRSNIQINRLSNVIVVEKALDAVSDRTVHISGTGTMAHIDETGTPVKTVSLDEVAKTFSISKIDAIKMDIEGAENLIFATASTSAILSTTKLIAVEVHDLEGLRLVQNRLRSEGYSVIGQARPEGDFLFSSLRGAARRPDVVLGLYGSEGVTVALRILSGAFLRGQKPKVKLPGLVYAMR